MKNLIYLWAFLLLISCKPIIEPDPDPDLEPTVEDVVSDNFVGIGTQIGGYDNLLQVSGNATFSQSDWTKIFSRLEFMRPGLVRIMGSEGWNYYLNGMYNPDKSNNILFKFLDFCQAQNIQVVWGEWGHKNGSEIDEEWLNRSVDFLEYMIDTKGYTCIKYFTMVNEPNGSWSSILGNFSLWRNLINLTHEIMFNRGLLGKVQLLGPDISISRDAFTGSPAVTNTFVSNTVREVDAKMGSYCYHLYPANDQVENGKFLKTMIAYKKLLPTTKDALITELGFKYYPASAKGTLNQQLIDADIYAADNANLMVYESVYGIDISASIIQLLMAGYKSAVVWRLDDAMYMDVTTAGVKLTRWGFWNSLGSESFNNPDDENLRPWFYPMSLLSRYFPTGSTILNVIQGDKVGLYAIAARKDNKYTIAIVNTSKSGFSFDLKMNGGKYLSNMKQYKYAALTRRSFRGQIDSNGFPVSSATINMDLSNNKTVALDIDASSFMLLTNME